MKNRHISPAELSRLMSANPSSVHGMLNRPTLQVQKLLKLSDILKYNFFREIAQKLPYKEPEAKKAFEEEAALKERIKELEIEATTLRRTLKDLVKG